MCIINNNAPEKKIVEDSQGPKDDSRHTVYYASFLEDTGTTKYFINISENPENKKLDDCGITYCKTMCFSEI